MARMRLRKMFGRTEGGGVGVWCGSWRVVRGRNPLRVAWEARVSWTMGLYWLRVMSWSRNRREGSVMTMGRVREEGVAVRVYDRI